MVKNRNTKRAAGSIRNGVLSLGGQPILSKVPKHCSLVSDPAGNGVFIRACSATSAARLSLVLGTPALRRFTVSYRPDPWWNKPAFGTRASEIPAETQFLMLELGDGSYAVLMPTLDGDFRCSIEGNAEQQLVLVVESGDPALHTRAATGLFVAVGSDPYALTAAAAASVSRFVGSGRLRTEKPLPAFVDHFGWCTWDAFYGEVTHDKVREGLESFRKGGLQPRMMILDDGWLTTQQFPTGEYRLQSFAADPKKFPGGLSPTVRMAKDEFGVETFLVWHAFQAYWGGVDSAAMPAYRTVPQMRDFSPGILLHHPDICAFFGRAVSVVVPEDIARFFQDFHRFLRRQGVDGVKVDNQSGIESTARGLGGRVALARAYHEALEGAVHTHFGGRLINCMSGSNDIILNTPNSTLTRTWTDFWPTRPESHGLHMVANAVNSLWMGQFVQPDWDMFHSLHPAGVFHAMGRAVSGGPIYVSDKPGVHDFTLLRKLVLSDGTILRGRQPGLPTRDCLFADPAKEDVLFKVFNLNLDAGVIGAFNAQYHAEESERKIIAGHVSPADVEGIEGDRFVVYSHQQGRSWLCGRNDRVPVALAEGVADVFTVVPIRDPVAPIGLVDKFNSAGAVTSKGRAASGGYEVALRDGGEFAAWCRHKPKQVAVNGQKRRFTFAATSGLLRVAVKSDGPCVVGIQ